MEKVFFINSIVTDDGEVVTVKGWYYEDNPTVFYQEQTK